MAGVSPAAIAFMNGNSYTWDADIEIENSAGPEVIGSLNGSFTSGMGRPRPIYPANLDSVVKEEVLELKFTTSAPPQRLVPPLAIMQTSSTPGESESRREEYPQAQWFQNPVEYTGPCRVRRSDRSSCRNRSVGIQSASADERE